MDSDKGIFITLEGGEGAGKSTQIELLRSRLDAAGFEVVCTREPGGTPGAEAIRHVILSGSVEELGPQFEAEMFAAARLDHVENLIAPSLDSGKVVICDRYIDSTRVYQGITGNVEMSYLKALEQLVCEAAWPDLTLILDLDPELGMKRASDRRAEDGTPDRFEKEDLDIQNQRREGFLEIAKQEPERCVIIDASRSVDDVHNLIWQAVSSKLDIKTD
ncbi:MAG: dTMP kinase [Pseudomonadota bacterium]